MELRDYQRKIVKDGLDIINKHGLLYLALQVRVGKTAIALSICHELKVDSVLFLTKLKVVPGITKDYEALGYTYNLTCINYESLHKIDGDKYDIIICDEAHSGLSAFPRPSKRTKQVKDLIKKYKSKVIFLSGTPTPESHSQIYHQLYVHPNNPFKEYANFYRWVG